MDENSMKTSQLAVNLLTAALLLASTTVLAQTAPEPKPAEESKITEDDANERQDDNFEMEQGQSPLDESFVLTRRDRVREQRKKALEDTKADVQIRSMYFDRDKFDNSESTAWGLGGYAGFKTGYFRNILAFGVTGYTSQPLYAPEGKGGTGVLTSNQLGYVVVGEVYGQFKLATDVNFDVGRKILNTPYINKSDTRMTPNTFQTAILQGVVGDAEASGQWRFGAGYVDAIKEKTSERFIPMSQAAGAADGVDRGVYVAGANYKRGSLSIGAVNYYSDDIINIFYTEAKYAIPLGENADLLLGLQYSDQGSTGDDLLTGSDFSTNQFGAKAELSYKQAVFSTSWTGNSDDADLRSPWGSIPSYNSVQVQDFNRAGEDAFMLRASYKFKAVAGLSAYALWVNGSQPTDPALSAQDEYDFNLQWNAGSETFKGFSVRARYAIVTQDSGGPDLQDFRLIFNYDPPGL